jgi:hypothetical protein
MDLQDLHINNCTPAFECDRSWNELELTENKMARFCRWCEKFVFLCETPAEVSYRARRLHCIAFSTDSQDVDRTITTDTFPNLIWMGQYDVVSEEYTLAHIGPTMTIYLNPTYYLEQNQLKFLSLTFDLDVKDYRLRNILCDGREHLLKDKLYPDMIESLMRELTEHKIEYRVSIDPV